jgi:hypothetical protein
VCITAAFALARSLVLDRALDSGVDRPLLEALGADGATRIRTFRLIVVLSQQLRTLWISSCARTA